MKFKREDGVFDVERFKPQFAIFITAQEIIVDNASLPHTKEMRKTPTSTAPWASLREPRLAHHELRVCLMILTKDARWPAISADARRRDQS